MYYGQEGGTKSIHPPALTKCSLTMAKHYACSHERVVKKTNRAAIPQGMYTLGRKTVGELIQIVNNSKCAKLGREKDE